MRGDDDLVNDDLVANDATFSAATVLDKMEEKEQLNKLHQAMRLMSREEQELLQFTRFQKLKYHEIATILQISESGVKMSLWLERGVHVSKNVLWS